MKKVWRHIDRLKVKHATVYKYNYTDIEVKKRCVVLRLTGKQKATFN